MKDIITIDHVYQIQLKTPALAVVEKIDNIYYAECTEYNAAGIGDNKVQAIDNMKDELFIILKGRL